MKPILNLNKHPKDCENLSLVEAINVRLSNDGSCLQTEEAIVDIKTINNQLYFDYDGNFNIIDTISCNKELIIFVKNTYKAEPFVDIYRYNEDLNIIKKVYTNLNYHNGRIKGAFTYNVYNELVIAFSEYDSDEDVPLRTINLGKFEDEVEQLPNELLPINPEVIIPTLKYDYVPGNLPKGWYYIFIRYKIDNTDYTQWFDVTGSILINNLERQSIFKFYGYKKLLIDGEQSNKPFSTGVLDHFGSENSSSNETLNLNLSYLDNRYKKYQIGFICVNNTNTTCYKSYDIDLNNNNYLLDINIMEEHDYLDMITNNYNFYNIKNIINYENRLYVSNYKEKLLNDYDTSKINLTLIYKNNSYNDVKNIDYKSSEHTKETYRTIDTETSIYTENILFGDTADAIIKPNIEINNKKYNTIFSKNVYLDLVFPDKELNQYIINLKDDNGNLKEGVVYKDNKYIVNQICKIITSNGYTLNVELNLTTESYQAYGTFKYTINNKTYITGIYPGNTDYSENYIFDVYLASYGNNDLITKDILIPKEETSFKNDSKYINTNNSFVDRKKETTLIPGEIYNFYIHFVDKYGFNTKGFRLKPKQLSEYTYIKISSVYGKFIEVNSKDKIFNNEGNINLNNENCYFCNEFVYKKFNIYLENNEIKSPHIEALNKRRISEQNLSKIKDKLYELYGGLSNNKDLTWQDITITVLPAYVVDSQKEYDEFIENYNSDNNILPLINVPIYQTYVNKNNEELFKIPYIRPEAERTNEGISYSFDTININVSDVDIPNGYIGYFISYEKYESVSKFTGLLTKYDFNDTSHINNENLTNHNLDYNSKMYFYTSDFDLLDKIDLNFNTLRIETKEGYNASENKDIIENSLVQNVNNLNLPEIAYHDFIDYSYYDIKDYKILIANDPSKNRFGLGTVLEIPIIKELFPDNEIKLYRASLLNINNTKYVNENKTLIKCTNIIYPNINNELVQYLNGRCTYNGFIIYDNNKFILDHAKTKVFAENNKEYIDYGTKDKDATNISAKFLAYVQMPVYKDFFYETKSFNNNPKQINFKLEDPEELKEDENISYELGCIVEPLNSIDLFKNNYNKVDELCPKIYQNNRIDINYLETFDKIIRRSDVIQDESSSNAWRQFGLENYKVIAENKGKITNIVGIGWYLIVHTEHSLFAFNNDNKLTALDKEIQLSTPDIFDIDYQEMLTSNLGYGGLQNNDDWILGTFGYIYYDKDSNRIFRFDNGKLDYIDNDIVQFLNKYKPKYIHFADDIKSNRILLNININDNNSNYSIELSYNYGINRFISTHIYNIQKVANTKNNLYLIYDNKINKFNYEPVLKNEGYATNDSIISFIINERYQSIKYLEYIIYKLYNVKVNTDDYISDNNLPPVEVLRKPYSGEQIRVYNDEIDTGWLDIKIDKEESKNVFSNYTKPYWNKGNWNFSYLRDENTKSRLYGNYFVVSIKFKGLGERIEFESLLYSISK